MNKSSRNFHSERQVISRIAEIHYSVAKRLGLWTHLPIREDCPSATLQNRVPTSGCAYRMQIINLPPHKTQAFGRDLLLQRKSRKHCRTCVLYGSSCGMCHKTLFKPSTADGWLFANDGIQLPLLSYLPSFCHTRPCEPNAFASNSSALLL